MLSFQTNTFNQGNMIVILHAFNEALPPRLCIDNRKEQYKLSVFTYMKKYRN